MRYDNRRELPLKIKALGGTCQPLQFKLSKNKMEPPKFIHHHHFPPQPLLEETTKRQQQQEPTTVPISLGETHEEDTPGIPTPSIPTPNNEKEREGIPSAMRSPFSEVEEKNKKNLTISHISPPCKTADIS